MLAVGLFTAKRLYSAAQGRRVSRRTLGRHSPSIQYAEGVSHDGMAESL